MPGAPPTSASRRRLLMALVFVAVIAAAAALLFMLIRPGEEEPGTVEPEPPTGITEPQEADFGAVDVPVETGQFLITVTGGGEVDLQAAGFGDPPEGTYYYVVSVLFENRGDTVPLNALPYAVEGSELRVDGAEIEGVLQVDFGSPISEGTVPSGASIPLRFVFAVPEGSEEFVFVWAPIEPGYPRIVVDVGD